MIDGAPVAYLEQLLELSAGDVEFAIAMHFDGGGIVPDEFRSAADDGGTDDDDVAAAPSPPPQPRPQRPSTAPMAGSAPSAGSGTRGKAWDSAAYAALWKPEAARRLPAAGGNGEGRPRPTVVAGPMGAWEEGEHPSWHLPPLPPPAQGRAPTDDRASAVVLVWLRAGDMRLTDNPALHAAAAEPTAASGGGGGAGRGGGGGGGGGGVGRPAVIPVYVEPTAREQRGWPVQGAAAYWMHHSLIQIQHALASLGSAVVLRRAADAVDGAGGDGAGGAHHHGGAHNDGGAHDGGDTAAALLQLVHETGATAVHFNAGYEPWRVASDEAILRLLRARGVEATRHRGNLLYEPWDARPDERSQSAGFGSVGFFLSAVQGLPPPPEPLPAPTRRLRPPRAWPHSVPLAALRLAAPVVRRDGSVVDWAAGLRRAWAVGEAGGRAALDAFLHEGLRPFESRERFRADQTHTAAISPHVRFGELSARTVRAAVREALGERRAPAFERRLYWRDLAYWSLWRFDDLSDAPFRKHYAAQVWSEEPKAVAAWVGARTGFPLVDAAMTQLWRTGWMPNYMRHVVAGFLVEFLNLDWRHGERWFHDTLVDADPAINAFMWQNGGHSGFDQWNFVMHPVFAAKSCDPEGDYVRRWLPQLARLPVEYIHCPWEAPFGLRVSARLLLHDATKPHQKGNYPTRCVADLEAARKVSHQAVMAVRRGAVGRQHVLPSGHEWWLLESGQKIVLITRQDYREGCKTKEGDDITGDDVITRQTAEPKWDIRRREKHDAISNIVRDCQGEQERRGGRAGGGGGGGSGDGGGKGKGKGAGKGAGGRGGSRGGAHSVSGLPRSKPSFVAR